jgi:alpha-mannosidase
MSTHPKFRLARLKKYFQLVESRIVRETVTADDVRVLEPAEPRYDAPPDGGPWKPIGPRAEWGGKQQWAYFRAAVAVPAHWKGQAIELRLRNRAVFLERPHDDNTPAGPEGQVFINGQRVGAIDQQHHRVRFPFEPGKTYDVRAVFFAARCACRHVLESLGLAWIDVATEKLLHDLRMALDVVNHLGPNSPSREKLVQALEAAVRAIDVRDIVAPVDVPADEQRDPAGELFYASVASAQKALDEARASVEPAADVPQALAVGHAHIDLAWLWPFTQTRHKCVRTWATQCRLLEQYPDWVFFQSSSQAYAWVEHDAPELFQKIRDLIAAGRWEADGAMWVETDTNIPSGESLVRQLLYGKRYFRDKLGVDSRMLWMPDVFGYSAVLPQLLKLADVEAFVTSKISWNQFNRFPYDTFRWRGTDGTEMPTHFITGPCLGLEWMTTYNTMMTVEEVKRSWDDYAQKTLLLDPLISFGYGDGGGGPTEEILERAQRLAAMPPVEGIPQVRFGRAAELIHRIASHPERLPVWDGELYLEYHRGTYTTQAWLKRANRKNEIRLHNVEWLASLAAEHGYRLDKAQLDAMWHDLLLIQFHDVLPGSSVGEVYDEVRVMQDRIAEQADAMAADAADVLCKQIDTSKCRKPVVLFNTLSWDRCEPVRLSDGTWRDAVTVPAGGWAVVDAADGSSSTGGEAPTVSRDGRELSNRYWRLRLDEQGRIVELYDRLNDRQVLPEGAVANEWQVFEDRPLDNDAWDIDVFFDEHPLPGPELVSINVVEQTDAHAAVELTWQMPAIGKGPRTTITQRIVLYAALARIDFETHADWHEHHQLLKVAFPVDVRATEATYQIQFGHLRRPTHRNTSWDVARFEVCAQQFMDLAEHGYGVALLNDCKYGHDALDGVMRLTCIKSPLAPDRKADQGPHDFTYALLPHAGTFQQAGVVRAAAELNLPLIVRAVEPSKGKLPATWSPVQCDSEAVVLDTLKPAEDGDGVIVRLYESHGSHAQADLTFAAPLKSVEQVNLLEGPIDDDIGLEHKGERVSLRVRPLQIVTLRARR